MKGIQEKSLSTLLSQFMGEADMGDAHLASLVNKQVKITSFLHRSTIRNWRNGSSKSVKDWRQLAAIAAVLDLEQSQADQLLFAGGCPSVQALQTMADDADQPFLTQWSLHESAEPQALEPIADTLPIASPILEVESAAPSRPLPQTDDAISRLSFLKVIVPLLLIGGLLLGASRWRSGGETPASLTVYSEPVSAAWDIWRMSWNYTVEPIKTDLAVEGDHVLNVTLSEYGGLTFFNYDSVETKPYQFITFYIRPAEVVQDGEMVLQVVIDDDDDFSNGEVGRLLIDDHIEGKITTETWHQVRIPLDSYSSEPFAIAQLAIHSPVEGKQPHFWIDQIQLVETE